MRDLHITQGNGQVVIRSGDDTIHVDILNDPNVHPTLFTGVPRLDNYITMQYPITYSNLLSTVLDLADSTNKIQAIKTVRRLFAPMGLREAKQIVDSIFEAQAKQLVDRE